MSKKQKFYAVKKGIKPGIYTDWNTCNDEAIKGFSCAEFKAFLTEEEANAYLKDEDLILKNDIQPRLNDGRVVAFVDGSYDEVKKLYSYGVLLLKPDKTQIELSGKYNNPNYVDLRNIAGELFAVINAIDWCLNNGYEKVSIFFDYEGIGKWANGEWEAHKSLTRFYKNFIDKHNDIIDIEFVKVAGHSNNIYNDRVDKIAKGAIAENKIIRDNGGNSGYIITPISENDISSMLNLLKSDYQGFAFVTSELNNRKTWTVTLEKEKITVILFNSIKMTVQGKRSNLFQIITTGIVEHIKCGDFIQVLKDAYGISINKDEVENAFNSEMATIKSVSLPVSLSNLIKQAIVNLQKKKDNNDIEFSMYTLPAFRALEGVLKCNLQNCNIQMNSYRFDMFEKDGNGVFTLKQNFRIDLDNNKITKLENCYNHLFNQRHTLCHFGIIIEGTDTTRLINSKEEANNIISDTLHIINNNFI
jgi:ribonuclease HI